MLPFFLPMKSSLQRCGAIFFVTVLLISCNYQHGLHPVEITGISGRVTFEGTWPDNTDWVRIICFQEKPKSQEVTDILLTLFDSKISDPLPQNVPYYDFMLELDPGVYNWIVVVFNSKDFPFKVIGEYEDQNGSVSVTREKLITGLNIIANFDKLANP